MLGMIPAVEVAKCTLMETVKPSRAGTKRTVSQIAVGSREEVSTSALQNQAGFTEEVTSELDGEVQAGECSPDTREQ